MKYKREWVIFVFLGLINIIFYSNKPLELTKKIFEWGFICNGFVLVEKYINEKLEPFEEGSK